jgi:hypothetical protein
MILDVLLNVLGVACLLWVGTIICTEIIEGVEDFFRDES